MTVAAAPLRRPLDGAHPSSVRIVRELPAAAHGIRSDAIL